MTLADLKPGQCAEISLMDTSFPGILRLMVLGLVEGARVNHRGAAIGGDPLEIGVHGAAVSVRLEQASQIAVRGIDLPSSGTQIP